VTWPIAFAGVLRGELAGQRVGVVRSGSNIDLPVRRWVLERADRLAS